MECGDAWRVRLPVTQYNQAGFDSRWHDYPLPDAAECIRHTLVVMLSSDLYFWENKSSVFIYVIRKTT